MSATAPIDPLTIDTTVVSDCCGVCGAADGTVVGTRYFSWNVAQPANIEVLAVCEKCCWGLWVLGGACPRCDATTKRWRHVEGAGWDEDEVCPACAVWLLHCYPNARMESV